MDMPVIGVEDWLNVWERSARVDIAQSTIASLTFEELQALDGEGGATLRDAIAAEKLIMDGSKGHLLLKSKWQVFIQLILHQTGFYKQMDVPARISMHLWQ